MAAPARVQLIKEPERPPRPRRPRITYRVEILPGGDPKRGEELLLRWLAEVLSE